MLTGKQRAFLRAMANQIDTTFQVGKGGVNDNVIVQFDQYLTAKELVKAHLLKSDDELPRDVADRIASTIDADLVSVTGRKFVLYRKSEKLVKEGKSIILPRG